MGNKTVLLIVLVGVILLAGCVQFSSGGEQQDYQSKGFPVQEINIGCLPGLIDSSVSFVVRNQDEYDALLVEYYEKTKEKYKELWGVTTDEELSEGIPFKDCDATLTPIDFERFTLLSHYAQGSGCATGFNKTFQYDGANKKVVFTIDVVEQGLCEPLRKYRTSVLIPKIPDDYTVDFRVTTQQQDEQDGNGTVPVTLSIQKESNKIIFTAKTSGNVYLPGNSISSPNGLASSWKIYRFVNGDWAVVTSSIYCIALCDTVCETGPRGCGAGWASPICQLASSEEDFEWNKQYVDYKDKICDADTYDCAYYKNAESGKYKITFTYETDCSEGQLFEGIPLLIEKEFTI